MNNFRQDTLKALHDIHAKDPIEGVYWRTAAMAIEVIRCQAEEIAQYRDMEQQRLRKSFEQSQGSSEI